MMQRFIFVFIFVSLLITGLTGCALHQMLVPPTRPSTSDAFVIKNHVIDSDLLKGNFDIMKNKENGLIFVRGIYDVKGNAFVTYIGYDPQTNLLLRLTAKYDPRKKDKLPCFERFNRTSVFTPLSDVKPSCYVHNSSETRANRMAYLYEGEYGKTAFYISEIFLATDRQKKILDSINNDKDFKFKLNDAYILIEEGKIIGPTYRIINDILVEKFGGSTIPVNDITAILLALRKKEYKIVENLTQINQFSLCKPLKNLPTEIRCDKPLQVNSFSEAIDFITSNPGFICDYLQLKQGQFSDFYILDTNSVKYQILWNKQLERIRDPENILPVDEFLNKHLYIGLFISATLTDRCKVEYFALKGIFKDQVNKADLEKLNNLISKKGGKK